MVGAQAVVRVTLSDTEDDGSDGENNESGLSLLGPCLLLVRAHRTAKQDDQPQAGDPGMLRRRQQGRLPPNSPCSHSSEACRAPDVNQSPRREQ